MSASDSRLGTATQGSIWDRLMRWSEPDPHTGCWYWTGSPRGKGYGGISLGGKKRAAHRVSYELFMGPIPQGLQIDHLCRRPSCINPDHLEPVTREENLRRGHHPNREKTACRAGHAYDIFYRGKRGCKRCTLARQRAGWGKRRQIGEGR
jgi:hypothetical protein